MSYVDGFVIPVPKQNINAYKDLAQKCGEIWMEHGALAYKECIAEDIDAEDFGEGKFRQASGASDDETVVFTFIIYKSRAHRDEVNKKAMEDSRIKESCDDHNMPFEMKRIIMGGFDVVVDL